MITVDKWSIYVTKPPCNYSTVNIAQFLLSSLTSWHILKLFQHFLSKYHPSSSYPVRTTGAYRSAHRALSKYHKFKVTVWYWCVFPSGCTEPCLLLWSRLFFLYKSHWAKDESQGLWWSPDLLLFMFASRWTGVTLTCRIFHPAPLSCQNPNLSNLMHLKLHFFFADINMSICFSPQTFGWLTSGVILFLFLYMCVRCLKNCCILCSNNWNI